MYYGNIKNCDIADGEGVRVSLFVSGCTHHCKGCFQPETWDFSFGEPYTGQTEQALLEMLAPGYINGLTLLGGEPMEPDNQRVLLPLLEKVRARYPDKTVWAYSGYTWEELTGAVPCRCRCEATDRMLELIDVLVDGEFMEEKKDISLLFRGSANQRLIDLNATRSAGRLTLLPLDRRGGGG